MNKLGCYISSIPLPGIEFTVANVDNHNNLEITDLNVQLLGDGIIERIRSGIQMQIDESHF